MTGDTGGTTSVFRERLALFAARGLAVLPGRWGTITLVKRHNPNVIIVPNGAKKQQMVPHSVRAKIVTKNKTITTKNHRTLVSTWAANTCWNSGGSCAMMAGS